MEGHTSSIYNGFAKTSERDFQLQVTIRCQSFRILGARIVKH